MELPDVRDGPSRHLRPSRERRNPAVRSVAALLLACVASTAAPGQEARLPVTWNAPEPVRAQLQKLLPPPAPVEGERRGAALRPWVREARRRIPEILASEGYFSPQVEVALDEGRESATVTIAPGPRTTVESVDIAFEGDLAGEGDGRAERRRELAEGWLLKAGQPFRSVDWEEAKNRLRERLTEEDYAAGEIADSGAVVDADAARAKLRVKLSSGPRFTTGDVRIVGLEHYPESVVRRVSTLRDGERYRLERLLELQRELQKGPWFSGVVVEIDREAGGNERVPVNVSVFERRAREVGLSVGYGTDEGARAEVALRHRNLFDRGWDLQSAVRVDRKRQIGYADVHFPPGLFGRILEIPTRDSAGVLAERTSIQGLETRRLAVAAYRQFTLEEVETRVGLSYQHERANPSGSIERLKRALAPVVAFTWRNVDDLFDPRKGGVLNVQFAGGARDLLSDQDFLKTYAQYQHWIPVSARDQLLLRAEVGQTFAESRRGIPEDFLFRAGGSRSVRGYAYQSLGAREGNAVVGGRYLLTASADYVHWFRELWGGAVFFDVGDAADSRHDWKGRTSYGVGVRYKTPAGPLAADIAYAPDEHKVRLAFSVTVAF